MVLPATVLTRTKMVTWYDVYEEYAADLPHLLCSRSSPVPRRSRCSFPTSVSYVLDLLWPTKISTNVSLTLKLSPKLDRPTKQSGRGCGNDFCRGRGCRRCWWCDFRQRGSRRGSGRSWWCGRKPHICTFAGTTVSTQTAGSSHQANRRALPPRKRLRTSRIEITQRNDEASG